MLKASLYGFHELAFEMATFNHEYVMLRNAAHDNIKTVCKDIRYDEFAKFTIEL